MNLLASPPKVLESCRGHLGITHGVLNVFVAEVCLKGPRVVPFIRQRVSTSVSEYVGVGLKPKLRLSPADRYSNGIAWSIRSILLRLACQGFPVAVRDAAN